MKKAAKKKAPAKSRKSAPVSSSPTVPAMLPSEPDQSLPTLEMLAQIAATIATKDEKPSEIARRAMSLIRACQTQLYLSTREMAEEINHPCPVADFISKFRTLARVHLADFLEVMMPESTKRTRLTKWLTFMESCLSVAALMGKSEGASFRFMLVARFMEADNQEGAVKSKELFELGEEFAAFLKRDWAAIVADKAQKSATAIKDNERMRAILSVAEKYRSGQSMTPDDNDLLKSVTHEEEEMTAGKMAMPIKERGSWEALIVSAKTPISGRRKATPKKNKLFSDDGMNGPQRVTDCP